MKAAAKSGLRAIVVGALLAGTLDIGAAAIINNVSPVLIAKFIASGVLGKSSFSIGAPAASAGLLIQWAMSLVIATIYWFVTARLRSLRARWWLGGLLAGVVIYLVMNFIVMPLSAAPLTLQQVIARWRPPRAPRIWSRCSCLAGSSPTAPTGSRSGERSTDVSVR